MDKLGSDQEEASAIVEGFAGEVLRNLEETPEGRAILGLAEPEVTAGAFVTAAACYAQRHLPPERFSAWARSAAVALWKFTSPPPVPPA